MDRKSLGKNDDGSAPSGDLADRNACECANYRGAFHPAGNFWATDTAGNFFGIGGGGPYHRTERFHRGISRLVRADGKKRNSLGGLGGNQRCDRGSGGTRNVSYRAAGNRKLDWLRTPPRTARNLHQQ